MHLMLAIIIFILFIYLISQILERNKKIPNPFVSQTSVTVQVMLVMQITQNVRQNVLEGPELKHY